MAAITPRQRTGWATANFVVIALALIPVLWLVSLSFKTPTAVLDPSFIPSQWTWGNYSGILTSSQFIRPLANSIGIGIISTLIAVILASMAAYAVARLRFPGKSVLIGMALLLLAGLSLVPEDLQGAAKVDGATGWQRFTKITLPLMKPAILVALLFRTLDSFRIFDNIYILTGGTNGTGSVSILGYDNLFNALNLGIGSAISVLIFICVAIIAVIFIKGFGTAAPGSDIGKR